MTHQQFFPFHNRLIRFSKKDGVYLEGVIVDLIPYSKKKKDTDYIFIPIENLEEWKNADDRGDSSLKLTLQFTIDIKDIVDAAKI